MAWYAVHTRSRHEDRVYLGLIQKSFEVFLPKIEVWSRRKDRRKKIMIPMFPGYLFVALETIDNYTKLDVLKTFGVVRILGKPYGSEPIPVPDEKIDAIMRIVNSRVEVQQIQYPKVGEYAKIIDGPFQGIEGLVVSTDPEKELFVITIELMQRSVAIKLEGFQVARL
ncbi:MAG TPA: UpxY family transcription antiterminator [Syntrophales bacterium]|jgi:transcription antitermination factor NusG|nr:UpxY family transcription antiterminator [Syntrophales bacterium]HOU78520.1 UpxY family transcription antiterminator [Syntrophales bacterium]HPC31603.1 UpxY family transcription antiterminator [Syntrophales bacterium]HQG34343.1 UpxY family transcription antiterminator [Syntrophales bacterium]HQI34906.1 UpxY family transcription antiterminator [Syntrophales bacterium]